jgi:hypothetical protein
MRCAGVHVPLDERRRFLRFGANQEDAIVMLDEWGDPEGAEISQIRDFMVDFRLNDEGDLELTEFGESCRDTILHKAYPRLRQALADAPTTPSGGATVEGKAMIREAVQEVRTRTLKPTRCPQPATEAARTLQKELGASAAYANRAVEEMAAHVLRKTPDTSRKQ